jgi:chaperonin cofactor prefoldin
LKQQAGGNSISEQVTAEEIQSLARELQMLRNQIQTISSQVSEYGITVEELSKQDPNKPIYRSLGNILLEVEDRDSLESELKAAQDALNEHLGRLVEREESIRKKYEEMAESFERA